MVFGTKSVPSLGLSWSCCVNRRYLLVREETTPPSSNQHNSNHNHQEEEEKENCDPTSKRKTPFMSFGFGYSRFQRRMDLVFSPSSPPNQSTLFTITKQGVVGIK